MAIFPLLAVGLIMKMVAVLFVICSVVLILIVLIQKGKGGGLSAALGGGMASGILGSKTGDFLTWVTIVLVSVFLTVQQEQPTDVGQSTPVEGTGAATGDANSGKDAALPDG